MLLDTPVQWVLEDGSVLSQLRRTDRPYGWAVSNFFYQPYLETKMERLLARYPNVTVAARPRARELLQDETGVASSTPRALARDTVRRPQPRRSFGERSRARAMVVACDGGRSGVRSQPRNQDGRQELPRAVACRRHQGEGGRGLLPPHAVLQLPLRPEGADRLLSAAERPPPVRVPADARPDQGADGGPGHCSFASRPAYRRRQGGGAAAARLHLQCARRRAMARRARADRGRRRAHDSAVHGPRHELRRARRAQPRLEARRGAPQRRGPETDRHV